MTGTPGQLPMFIVNPAIDDQPPATATDHPGDAPTCPSCRLRPARWNTTRNQYARYCSGSHCSNHQRLCTWCGTTYQHGAPGAGTKYCSDQCKAAGYKATANQRPADQKPCANCNGPIRRPARNPICSPCRTRFTSQIDAHHLDTAWAIRLINATTCDACGERLSTDNGRHRGQIDHDHNCCPGGRSCGNCIRGIICNRCNTVAAAIENDPQRHAHVLNYLRARP